MRNAHQQLSKTLHDTVVIWSPSDDATQPLGFYLFQIFNKKTKVPPYSDDIHLSGCKVGLTNKNSRKILTLRSIIFNVSDSTNTKPEKSKFQISEIAEQENYKSNFFPSCEYL